MRESKWYERVLVGIFCTGLSDNFKEELATCEQPVSFKETISLVNFLDNYSIDTGKTVILAVG